MYKDLRFEQRENPTNGFSPKQKQQDESYSKNFKSWFAFWNRNSDRINGELGIDRTDKVSPWVRDEGGIKCTLHFFLCFFVFIFLFSSSIGSYGKLRVYILEGMKYEQKNK